MRRILLGLILLSLACKSSSGSSQDVVLVNVDAPNLTGITHLNVTFTNAGTQASRSYPETPSSTPIVFPTTFSATMPASRIGNIDVSIDAFDAQGGNVAHGQNSKDLVVGGETDITVNLAAVTMGPDAGAGGQGGAPATGGGTAGAGGGTGGAGGAGGVKGGSTSAGGTGGAGGAGGVKGGSTSAGGGTGGAGGAGGVKGGSTAAGGSASAGMTGGSTGSGGSSGVCTPGLIDDMEQILGGWLPACEGRMGKWYTYNDGDPNTVQTPVPGQAVPYSTPGANSSAHSIRTYGKCAPVDPVAKTQFGAAIGFDLDNPVATGTSKLGYDASARGYSGMKFWARLGETAGASPVVSLHFPDINTDPSGGVCSTGCYDDYLTSITLTPSWTQYTVYWTQLTRGGWGVPRLPFASNGIVSVQWHFVSGTTFDMYVDDVAFVTDVPGADAGVDAVGGAGGVSGTDAGVAGSGGGGAGGTAATAGSGGGTGGVGGSGGSSSTATGGSTVTCSPPKSTGGIVCPGNFCTIGTCSGYDFTYTDLTGKSAICMAPNNLCVAGTTGAWNPPAGTVWGVGFGVNLSPFSTPVQLSGTGVTIALSSLPAGVVLTVGVAGYCAVITAATQTIPWTSFNTICSGPATGVALTGTPNTPTIQFSLSSGSTVGTFDFCVTALSFQ